jgi:serine/threonine protein kinase/WD40 repeat protein
MPEESALPPGLGSAATTSDAGRGPAAASAPAAPLSLPGYEILGELGRGGMGVVYKARQVGLDRVVALKMVLAGAHAGAAALDRFRREAQAAARLQHPNIVTIYEIHEHEGVPCFAMEYVDGGSLAAKLGGGPLPAAAAAELVETLARAVHYAHERGIVHRDLKPANILLQRKATTDNTDATDGKARPSSSSVPSVLSVVACTPKITDFGLAKQLDSAAGLTGSGVILGTPEYLAPEQATGKATPVGPTADVYGLGAVLYECLTGRPPFQAQTPLETVMQVISQAPVAPRRVRPEIPDRLEQICLRCLEKGPGRRFPTAAALADALGAFRQQSPPPARSRRPRWLALAGACGVVALLAAAGLWLLPGALSGPGPRPDADPNPGTETAPPRDQPRQEPTPPKAEQQQPATGFARWRQRNSWKEDLAHVGVLAFSPDGRKLAVATNPGRVRVRDAATGEKLQEISTGRPTATCLAFSPDSTTLAIGGGKEAKVTLWAFPGKKERHLLEAEKGETEGLVFSPDGKTLATFSWDRLKPGFPGEANLWDADTGKKRAPLPHAERVVALTFSPDSRLLASASTDQTVKLWDAVTGKHRHTLPHGGAVFALAFAPDGRTLLTAAPVYPDHRADRATGEAHLWDADTGKETFRLPDVTEPVVAAAFAPDGKRFALLTGDRVLTKTQNVQVWEVPPAGDRPRRVQRVPIPPNQITLVGSGKPASALAFLPDGRTLATWTISPLVLHLWDAATGKELTKFERHDPLVFSRDGRLLAGVTREGMVQIWEAVPRP